MDMKPYSFEQYKKYYEENEVLHRMILRLTAELAIAKADAEKPKEVLKSVKAVK
jgi:hypothetical protein